MPNKQMFIVNILANALSKTNTVYKLQRAIPVWDGDVKGIFSVRQINLGRNKDEAKKPDRSIFLGEMCGPNVRVPVHIVVPH